MEKRVISTQVQDEDIKIEKNGNKKIYINGIYRLTILL